MQTTNAQIRQKAMATLKGNWGDPVIFVLVAYVLLGWTNAIILLSIPMIYGVGYYFLKRYRGDQNSIKDLFGGFCNYLAVLGTGLQMLIQIVLWSILLYIPGVIKMYAYSMTFYIMIDNPEMKYTAAIAESRRIMKGNKMRLFMMSLNFLMWTILSAFTLGIALLWVIPYMQTTMAAFYEEVKAAAGPTPAPVVKESSSDDSHLDAADNMDFDFSDDD